MYIHGTLARVHAATALWEDDYYPATLVSFTAAARSDVIKLGKEQYVMHFDDGKIQERLSLPDPAVRIMSRSVERCRCKFCLQRSDLGRALPLAWAVACRSGVLSLVKRASTQYSVRGQHSVVLGSVGTLCTVRR